jgi:Protein of unknown function (DUF2917)
MKPVLDIKPIQLQAGTIHCIDDGKGLQITAVGGTVWVTQAGDTRDVIIARGQSFILDRNGRAIIYALKDAAIVVGLAGHITAADFGGPASWDEAA